MQFYYLLKYSYSWWVLYEHYRSQAQYIEST